MQVTQHNHFQSVFYFGQDHSGSTDTRQDGTPVHIPVQYLFIFFKWEETRGPEGNPKNLYHWIFDPGRGHT